MAAHPSYCPECKEAIEYWRVHCRCGHFLGYPNYREAAAERSELKKRYVVARDDCTSRGVGSLLDKLKNLARMSRPVIAMPFAACDNILRPGKYRNYYQRIESGERDPASRIHHSDRDIVGARIFPKYNGHMHYAALSSDGRGLSSYGAVAVRWEVTATYIGRRASLLEMNSYAFFNQYSLGDLGASIPQGYRAVWKDRMKLAVAKIGPSLTSATSERDLPNLMLKAGTTRNDDDFIEVAIYAEEGLDTRDVNLVIVQQSPTTSEEAYRRDLVSEICSVRRIAFVD